MKALQMKKKIMFDTNAFDKVQENNSEIRKKTDKYDYYITAIQIQEILAIPENKKDIRDQNLFNIIELRPTLVPTPFTWDYFDFSQFSFSVEPAYWKVLKDAKSNRNDALIAATAIQEGCILVTNDTELLRKMKMLDKSAITFDTFISDY